MAKGHDGHGILDLTVHPNQKLPALPPIGATERDFRIIVTWAVDSVAEYISPLKEEGENDSFACEDVAESIQYRLRMLLLKQYP